MAYPSAYDSLARVSAGAGAVDTDVNQTMDPIENVEHARGLSADTRSPTGTDVAKLKELLAAFQVATSAPSSPVTGDRWLDTNAAPTLQYYDGSAWQRVGARDTVRVTSNVTVSATTTLATVTGLSQTVGAGLTYEIEAHLYVTADATGGQKYALAGTATATNLVLDTFIGNLDTPGVTASRATALATAAALAGSGDTTYEVTLRGTITINAGGSLLVQAAQQSASGATVILRGSTFRVTPVA